MSTSREMPSEQVAWPQVRVVEPDVDPAGRKIFKLVFLAEVRQLHLSASFAFYENIISYNQIDAP
jgi:hypothetical protein